MTMAAGREIKREFMTKRSVNKNTLTSENYKDRWFILSDKALIYKDGSRKKVGSKEKGCIALKSMKAVEEVKDLCLDQKVNVFQIMYQESKGHPYTLYIVAGTNNQRLEWIAAIREGAVRESASFYQKYHVGAWTRSSGKYNCCDQIARNAVGCEPAFHVRQVIHSPNGRPVQTKTPGTRPGPLPSLPGMTPPSSGKKMYVAIYDYEPQTDGDLELRQGEEYEIIDQSRDNWWQAIDLNGVSGYIPANYVKKKFDLEIYDWFRKDISRQRCEFILSHEGSEGCFLVRDSSTPGLFTLSLFTSDVNQRVRHYHIQKNDEGFFYLSSKYSFASIPELIHYHKHNSGGLSNRLRFPPASRSQPTTAGFGYNKFEIDPSTLKMGEHLGSGCFGIVYKAYMTVKGRTYPVAVKQLREGQMSEAAFIDEAKTMTQLSHRHLVQLYGVVTRSRPLSIVTEFMQHGSLHNYLRRNAGVLLRKPAKLLEYCLHVSQGMEYLESRKYIHRDLAARNCLIGNEDIVKVADFGLARYVLDDEYTSSTGAKFPIKWAPPEVLSYTRFSSKSDCWAFGVLMWEVFSGGLSPYEGMSNAMVVDQICNKRRRLDRPQKCDPVIYKIMLRCWEQRPEDRPTFHALNLTLEKMGEDWEYSDQPQMSAPFVL